jgi:Fe-S cluster assembly scaffold protein SufB
MQDINDKRVLNFSAKNQSDAIEDIEQHVQNQCSLKINIDQNCECYVSDKHCRSLKNIECVVGCNAKLIFLTDRMYDTVDITCMNGSTVYYIQIARLDMSSYTQSVFVHMQENVRAVVRIFPFLNNDARCIVNTLQEHIASHSTSDLYVQSLISKNAQFDHKAMIIVPQGVHKNSIAQKTVVFMVGDQCRASAVPSFNIASKDTRCEHGAAIGMCDELEKWYLNARGLDEKLAARVIIKARCLSSFEQDLNKNVYNEIALMMDTCLAD